MKELYIGLMSGTSMDGIDAGLVNLTHDSIESVGFYYQPYPEEIRATLSTLSNPQSHFDIRRLGQIDSELAHLFAKAVQNLLKKTGHMADDITAIGSHGQTIFHSPQSHPPFTLQIADPNIIAEQTQITTIADFRRRDMAAGGQGAPLVPAFHRAIVKKHFSGCKKPICLINIGGIANITLVSEEKTLGFDTGPGNCLMDAWIYLHQKKDFDANGSWAKTGSVDSDLLNQLKEDPYFKTVPPKSTGKEYFSLAWLNEKINQFSATPPQNIQATLCQLTADTISAAVQGSTDDLADIYICGGGVHNHYLVELMENQLNRKLHNTNKLGIDPDHMEAMAFAWLAKQTLRGHHSNLPEVTGARHGVVLGGIYPGKNFGSFFNLGTE